jgi:hypothetical protein
MNKPAKSILEGLLSIAFVGAVLGIGAGTLAAVAIWIVRALT